jgi:hypothetical protein
MRGEEETLNGIDKDSENVKPSDPTYRQIGSFSLV